MKLLYIDPIRLPTEKAHGIQIMEMCAAFKRAGADIELVVSDRKTPIGEDPFTYYAIDDKFPIKRLHAPDLVAFGPIGFWLFLRIFSRRALRYAHKAGADVVYTRTPAVANMFARRYRGKVVLEVHARHKIPHAVLQKLALVVPITRSLAKWYEARGVSREKIQVAPDGVNLAAFDVPDKEAARRELHRRLGLAPDARIALYLGSFGVYNWKGIDVAKVAAEHAPDVTWLFVGGSESECQEFMRGAPRNVRTLPRAKRSEVAQLLGGADALLLPNKKGDIASEQDTSPLKLFEYMASGVPIIASDLPSIREILDERTAYLVPPNEPAALAAAVSRAAEDTAASEKTSIARVRVAAYTWGGRAKALIERMS